MQDDALEKVRAGITTLDEALRVVPFEAAAPSECSSCGQPVSSAHRFCPHCGATRAQRKEVAGRPGNWSVMVHCGHETRQESQH